VRTASTLRAPTVKLFPSQFLVQVDINNAIRHRYLHGTFLRARTRADGVMSVSTGRRREFAIDRIASANATGGEQEPVHEYALAVVVRVVREQPVPLVLLLASAISAAPIGLRFPIK